MEHSDVTRGQLVTLDGAPFVVHSKDGGMMALVCPGDVLPEPDTGAGHGVLSSGLDLRDPEPSDKKHVVEFLSMDPNAVVKVWNLVEEFTGPNSYAQAVTRARRFAEANQGGQAKVRVTLVEVLHEYTS